MKCFGLGGGPKAPATAPESWTAKDVRQWAQARKVDPTVVSGKDGRALLALDLDAAKDPKLRTALNGLRQEWGLAPLQPKPAAVAPPAPEAPADAPEASAAASQVIVATPLDAPAATAEPATDAAADADAQVEAAEACDEVPAAQVAEVAVVDEEMTQLEITDRVTQESITDPTPVVAVPSFVQFLGEQTQLRVQDWAVVLQPYTPDMDVDMVVSFLEGLGKGVGGALAEAATAMPSFGVLFGACVALAQTAACAGVARENCSKAAVLACDTLRILDGAWRRTHSAGAAGGGVRASTTSSSGAALATAAAISKSPTSEAALVQLTESMRTLQATVLPFSQAGWLVELCCNERVKERFDAAHNAVIDTLKAEGLELLPGGKPIPRGDYRDVPRAVRRLVRQHGNGSVTAGLLALKVAGVQSEGVKELAALLELGGPDDSFGASLVQAELEALPSDSGMDIEVYYNSVLLGDNAGGANHAVFEWYDREEQLGYIDLARFQRLLDDLGLLEGKTEAEAQSYVLSSFKAADTKGEGVLRREPFCAFYATLTTTRARQQLRACMGLAAEAELRSVYGSFASFGSRTELTDIDNARFFKLTKDSGLIAANLTSTDVDIIFAKAKAKGARRMTFDQFVNALSMCADKKGVTLESVARTVLLTGGPVAHATKPDTVRLHDDKSTYSGVYQRGGPRAVDPPKNDLASFLDRSDADVRGVKKTPTAPKAAPALKGAALSARKPPMSSPPPEFLLRTSMGPGALAAALGNTTPPPTTTSVSRRSSFGTAGAPADLREMYMAFSSFGTPGQDPGGMGLSHFQKLCRECRLLDAPGKSSGFNSTRADLIFTKVKQPDRRTLNLAEFQRALALIAEAKGVPVEDITAAICNSDGPLLTRMVMA